jgi:ribosomal protein S8
MRKNIINSIKLIGNNKDATFISITNLWKKNKGQSTLVLNTSKGLITDQKARQLNVGGKLFLVIN